MITINLDTHVCRHISTVGVCVDEVVPYFNV